MFDSVESCISAAPGPATETSVSWTTSLSMEGVSAADITEADEVAIKESIAAGSEFITADDITITQITDVASRRLGSLQKRTLLSAGVEIEYETTVVLEGTTFADPEELFESITAEIETHVVSGDLETSLKATGSSALAAVDVSEEEFVSPTDYSTEVVEVADDDDKAAEGPLAGGMAMYAIIAVAALVLIAGGCWCMKGKKSSVAPLAEQQ